MKKMINKTINQEFINICKMTQNELKIYLNNELTKYYKNPISQDGFIYAKGKDKILLTAHMDTVHKKKIKVFYEEYKNGKHIISSPQGIGGDDRCGIYMILEILKKTKLRPYILFCEDEEIGGIGSEKFTETKFIKELEKLYFMIELDRKGSNDLVYYDDINEEFHEFAEKTTGFIKNIGSFSDISVLSPAAGISSVNISCGYYNQHTPDEYVILEEMENSKNKIIKLIKEGIKNKIRYEYKENKYNIWNDIYWDKTYKEKTIFNYLKTNKNTLYIQFIEDDYDKEEYLQGNDENELWGIFFFNHPTVCFNDIIDFDYYPIAI